MVHFTCDLCGKDLTLAGESRYVVKIEAYPSFDPTEITEDDLDEDHMEEISQILQHDDAPSLEDIDVPLFKGFRYDLCPACHGRFIKDPLNRDMARSLNFSEN
jgi:hypothetical protein